MQFFLSHRVLIILFYLFLDFLQIQTYGLLIWIMMKIGPNKVCFIEPSHTVPFIMTIEEGGFLDVDDQLLCLHFDIQHGRLVLVEREEYREGMVLIRIVYQRTRFSNIGCPTESHLDFTRSRGLERASLLCLSPRVLVQDQRLFYSDQGPPRQGVFLLY